MCHYSYILNPYILTYWDCLHARNNRMAIMLKKRLKTNIYMDDNKQTYYLDGELHREDGPAIEWASGTKEWWVNGELHRENGPAIEFANGSKQWYVGGELHRENGPAIECVDGYKEWRYRGILQRLVK
jgi:hypothetical protein